MLKPQGYNIVQNHSAAGAGLGVNLVGVVRTTVPPDRLCDENDGHTVAR